MRIGIIGAMDIEVKQLCEQLTDAEVSQKAGLEFHAGKLAGVEVVVVRRESARSMPLSAPKLS